MCMAGASINHFKLDMLGNQAVTLMWMRMRCRNNREAMDKIVEVLIEKETIDGKEFRALLSECASLLCC